MTTIIEFLQAHPVVLKVIGVALLIHGLSGLVYLIPKVVFSRPLPLRLEYLLSPLMFVWFPFMELMRHPWWRKKWLQKSGVAEDSVMLEEGCVAQTGHSANRLPLILTGQRAKTFRHHR